MTVRTLQIVFRLIADYSGVIPFFDFFEFLKFNLLCYYGSERFRLTDIVDVNGPVRFNDQMVIVNSFVCSSINTKIIA